MFVYARIALMSGASKVPFPIFAKVFASFEGYLTDLA
jgi:hypothetical protein